MSIDPTVWKRLNEMSIEDYHRVSDRLLKMKIHEVEHQRKCMSYLGPVMIFAFIAMFIIILLNEGM